MKHASAESAKGATGDPKPVPAESSGHQRRGRPFAPGQSGNPGGRPRGCAELRELCREGTAEAIARIQKIARGPNPTLALAACKTLLEYGWGRPGTLDDEEKFEALAQRLTELEREREVAEALVPAYCQRAPEP